MFLEIIKLRPDVLLRKEKDDTNEVGYEKKKVSDYGEFACERISNFLMSDEGNENLSKKNTELIEMTNRLMKIYGTYSKASLLHWEEKKS